MPKGQIGRPEVGPRSQRERGEYSCSMPEGGKRSGGDVLYSLTKKGKRLAWRWRSDKEQRERTGHGKFGVPLRCAAKTARAHFPRKGGRVIATQKKNSS